MFCIFGYITYYLLLLPSRFLIISYIRTTEITAPVSASAQSAEGRRRPTDAQYWGRYRRYGRCIVKGYPAKPARPRTTFLVSDRSFPKTIGLRQSQCRHHSERSVRHCLDIVLLPYRTVRKPSAAVSMAFRSAFCVRLGRNVYDTEAIHSHTQSQSQPSKHCHSVSKTLAKVRPTPSNTQYKNQRTRLLSM